MALLDLYSKRRKRELGLQSDVFTYDNFGPALRNQLCFIVSDVLNVQQRSVSEDNFNSICQALRREYGLNCLVSSLGARRSYDAELLQFIRDESDIDRVLDAVELAFIVAETFRKEHYVYSHAASNPGRHIDSCIAELNARFKENGKGYELNQGVLVRVDSELLHVEVVKPAIGFLNGEEYSGPRDEFFSAYEHFRHGDLKEAINDALKAFESTMKVVLDARCWEYEKTSPAKKLLAALIANSFFPSYYQNHLNSLSALLESSVPTIRNKEGGHGQGAEVKILEPEIAAYVLHMTASAILMICKLERKTRS